MSEADYKKWRLKHGGIFGFAFDADVVMLANWYAILGECEPEELYHATEEICRSTSPPRNLRDHLAEIQRHVRVQRAAQYKRQAVEASDRGTCTRCQGGFIEVPHTTCLTAEGDFQPVQKARGGACYYTMAVLCTCPLGRWLQDHTTKNERVNERRMNIEEYTAINPHWPAQMRARREIELASVRLTSRPDPGWDELVKRVLTEAKERAT